MKFSVEAAPGRLSPVSSGEAHLGCGSIRPVGPIQEFNTAQLRGRRQPSLCPSPPSPCFLCRFPPGGGRGMREPGCKRSQRLRPVVHAVILQPGRALLLSNLHPWVPATGDGRRVLPRSNPRACPSLCQAGRGGSRAGSTEAPCHGRRAAGEDE